MFPLNMIHKTCSINYGHLADLQKIATDLNKKKLSFDKISPRDFYFFPFFSICTCNTSHRDKMTAHTDPNSTAFFFNKNVLGGTMTWKCYLHYWPLVTLLLVTISCWTNSQVANNYTWHSYDVTILLNEDISNLRKHPTNISHWGFTDNR